MRVHWEYMLMLHAICMDEYEYIVYETPCRWFDLNELNINWNLVYFRKWENDMDHIVKWNRRNGETKSAENKHLFNVFIINLYILNGWINLIVFFLLYFLCINMFGFLLHLNFSGGYKAWMWMVKKIGKIISKGVWGSKKLNVAMKMNGFFSAFR